jgi:hypothetical protein
MRNEVLIDYVFHYNPYRKQWAAVHRDHYLEYFNGKYEFVEFHGSINTLVKYISSIE